VTRPAHVQIADITVYPTNQCSPRDIARVGESLGAPADVVAEIAVEQEQEARHQEKKKEESEHVRIISNQTHEETFSGTHRSPPTTPHPVKRGAKKAVGAQPA
jgi:hypothetical protein